MVPREGQGTPEVHLQEAPLIFRENGLVALNCPNPGPAPGVCMWVSTKQKKVLLEDRPGVEQGVRSVQEQVLSNRPLGCCLR